MQIKEVEEKTGITSKNIRFYEKEGLLSPKRNIENRYRRFTDEDVRKLKEIKLLRKLGIALTDIKNIQSGNMTLNECMGKYLSYFVQHKKELERVIELCTEIQKKETDMNTIDADFYLEEINSAENKGSIFVDIAKDFITKARSVLTNHAKIFFEPNEPITNQYEFIDELEKYAEREKKSLIIVKMGMCPTILLDEKRYMCNLEMPRSLHFPFSIFFLAEYNYNYRFVYLYEDDSDVW